MHWSTLSPHGSGPGAISAMQTEYQASLDDVSFSSKATMPGMPQCYVELLGDSNCRNDVAQTLSAKSHIDVNQPLFDDPETKVLLKHRSQCRIVSRTS